MPKSEIFERLREGGSAIVNADNEFWPKWREKGIRCAFSSRIKSQPFHARDMVLNEQGCAEIRDGDPQEVAIDPGHPGPPQRMNALAAAAGLSGARRFSGLGPGRSGTDGAGRGRFCVQRWGGLTPGGRLTYNASVESVLAGIDALTAMGGYKVLVFGYEGVGVRSLPSAACQVGRHARESAGSDAVLTVGNRVAHRRCRGWPTFR